MTLGLTDTKALILSLLLGNVITKRDLNATTAALNLGFEVSRREDRKKFFILGYIKTHHIFDISYQ